MTAFFSKFFKDDSADAALGIDIGSSAIKVVELKIENDQAVLGTYASIALGPYANETIGTATKLSEQQLTEALTDVIRESKATTKSAGVAIPFASSLVSTLSMPNVSNRQLKDMVPLEARKYIPVPMAEVELDWFVIPESEGGHSIKTKEVLVVAIHKDALSRYGSVISEADIEQRFFEIEIFSSLRTVAGRDDTPTAIIDCGAASTKLYIVERGVLRGSHTINKGAQDITRTIARAHNMDEEQAEIQKRMHGMQEGSEFREDALLVVDYILSEARTMILSAERKLGRKVERVVLLGGGATLKGLQEVASEKLHHVVEPGNPFTRVRTPVFLEKTLKEVGPEFAVALGAALRAIGE